MQRSTLGIILAVLAVLVILGLVMANNRTPNTTPTPTTNTTDTSTEPVEDTTQPAATDAVEADEVEIEDMTFSPAAIKVKKGTTVTWKNRDSVEHTVTPDDEGSFEGSELLGPDEEFSVTFNEVGTFSYHCIPHPEMTGTVEVVEG